VRFPRNQLVLCPAFSAVNFSSAFSFFGRRYTSVYANNNGLLSFNLPVTEYIAQPFPIATNDIIAPL
jgi:hypothetical protein